jgi:lipopolysaccharide/colanic/teichoic acid biosynthesis glycosyltransferase
LRDRLRLDVLPGLTCIWQVSGRSLVPFPKQVDMDVEYIEKRSLWFDVKLIVRTIPAILFPEGAY